MFKLRPVTIILFLAAVAVYIVAPPLGVGLFGVGILIELAAWLSAYRDYKRERADSENP